MPGIGHGVSIRFDLEILPNADGHPVLDNLVLYNPARQGPDLSK
jgi:hypothetical protein